MPKEPKSSFEWAARICSLMQEIQDLCEDERLEDSLAVKAVWRYAKVVQNEHRRLLSTLREGLQAVSEDG